MSFATESVKREYDSQGYAILRDVFRSEEMDAITARIDVLNARNEAEIAVQGSSGISQARKISFTHHLHQQDEEILRFMYHPHLLDLSVGLLGPDVRLYWDQSVYKHPEADRDFPWHQDNGYAPTEPESYLTVWIALTDATVENGCIWVLPGSHRQGPVEHRDMGVGMQGYFGEDAGVAAPIPKGSLVAFQSLLFHRSTPNRSSHIRKGLIIQYSVDGMRNPETGAVYNDGPLVARGGRSTLTL